MSIFTEGFNPEEELSREKHKIGVIGCGSFGTAMAAVCARNGHDVVMYARDPEQAKSINESHVNPRYLSSFQLSDNISATTNIKDAIDGAAFVILAIPAQKSPDFVRSIKDVLPKETILCSTSKGLYLAKKQLLSDAILEALDREQPLAFLSGPSFAKEIMEKSPTAVVVASKKLYHAVKIQRAMSSVTFRIYTSQDTIGVELGGALKNPLAIGAGMIEGSGYGYNSLAAYVTRSCFELKRLCVAMGGQPDTISGLAGVGDLMLTAFGSLSRNRTAGQRLVQGEKLEDIMKTTTIEGVPTAAVAVYYADICGLDLPLFRTTHAVLNGKIDTKEAFKSIMTRRLKSENEND